MTDLDGADPGAAGLRQAAHDVVHLSDNRNILDEGLWARWWPAYLELCAEKRRVCCPEGVRSAEHEEVGKVGRGHPEVRTHPFIKHLSHCRKYFGPEVQHSCMRWYMVSPSTNSQSIDFESLFPEGRPLAARHAETAYALLDVEPRAVH